ncbi:hypothetical protein CJF31_00005438 [Rutstroemia sp. NJR-2017a BVV2]|nr:hypothetical protein CJF31_00005438 [Rutstroemia sp. NJR-2017a BVV2]
MLNPDAMNNEYPLASPTSPRARAMSAYFAEGGLTLDNLSQSLYPEPNDDEQSGEETTPYEQDLPPKEWDGIITIIKKEFPAGPQARSPNLEVEKAKLKQASDVAKKLKKTYYDALFRTLKSGKTFLHHLLSERSAAQCCHHHVLYAILECNPKSIESTIEGNNVHPLCEAIQNLHYGRNNPLVETMILFMEKENPNRELENENGEGKKCIEVAFEALTTQKPFSLFFLRKLVKWATEPMLLNTDNKDEPIPLHLAVVYARGYEDPKNQPELVKCLLDRCEKSLYVKVPAKRFKLRDCEITVPSSCSVYQWHKLTAKQFLANSPGNTNAQHDLKPPRASKNHKEGKTSNENNTSRDDPNSKDIKEDQDSDQRSTSAARQTDSSEKEEQQVDNEKCKSQPPGQLGGAKPTREADRASKLGQRRQEAKKASVEVIRELQLRYLRSTIETPPVDKFNDDDTSQPDESDAKIFFGEDVRNVLLRLDFREHPSGESMKEHEIKKFFKNRRFNKILRYVSLPQASVSLEIVDDAKSKSSPPRYQENRLFYFDWLHSEKGVEKILKVTVDDMEKPHRDEDIEDAIGGMGSLKHSFDVEILEWRKLDLCPKTIKGATPNVRELHLEWSGNNSVLRGWSAIDGLPSLEMLRQIHLTYTTGTGSSRRTQENIREFKERLEKCRLELRQALLSPKASDLQTNNVSTNSVSTNSVSTNSVSTNHVSTNHVSTNHVSTERSIQSYPTIKLFQHEKTTSGAELPPLIPEEDKSAGAPKHRWLKYMEDFVSFIPAIPVDIGDSKLSPFVTNNVTVALIDDGVDVFTNDMEVFSDRILDGASFDRSEDGHSPPEWYSLNGHGTLMAKLILAVCPWANIVPYRVLMRPDKGTGMLRPEPESAAKAIIDAIDRGVDIISMSWSIEGDIDPTKNPGLHRLANVMTEVHGQNHPLMYCAAADDGTSNRGGKKEYPYSCHGAKIFRIGAATDNGQTWLKVTDPTHAHFFFPGVDVPDLKAKFQYQYESFAKDPDTNSGSSIATALAAGLAALILHCTKLGIYYTEKEPLPTESIKLADLMELKTFDKMKEAFNNISTENLTNQRVAYPAQRFERATEAMRNMANEARLTFPGRLEPIAVLIRNTTWRNS